MKSNAARSSHVVLFDGHCNLCNGFVNWLIRNDRSHNLHFASLQGAFARGLNLPPVDSVVYLREDKLFVKSTAAVEILLDLGGLWKVAKVFLILPQGWRDRIYDWVARHRYAWFGTRETCRRPSPEERELFLD